MKALEILGYGSCHHTETIGNESFPYRNSRLWRQAMLTEDREVRRKILRRLYEAGGFRSGCDYPTAFFVDDLVDMYPEAKVCLLMRCILHFLEDNANISRDCANTQVVHPRRTLFTRRLAQVC